MPRVSIITPVFNGIGCIDQCVRNVQEQGFPDLEHLIIDGGSIDGTAERLSQLSLEYPNIRYVSEKDRGQSDAMNKGLKLSLAPIIGILNVDDFYQPSAIMEGVTYLESHLKCDFVVGDCNVLGDADRLEFVNRPRDLRLESLLLGWHFAEHPVNPSAYFYRKSIHEKVGYYRVEEHFAMDIHFLYDCATLTKMTYVPRNWGNFRLRPGTKTFGNRNEISKVMLKLREERIAGLTRFSQFKLSLRWRELRARRALQDWSRKFAGPAGQAL